jgi:phytoene desaturase
MKSALIIGAGFGGLALAIRLKSAGIAKTILEARSRPGGRAFVRHRDGWYIRCATDGDNRPRL